MKKYEDYQPSGVHWLDKVPVHWKSIKLKFLFEGWMGGSWGNDPTGDENDLICVRVADFDFGNRTLKRKDFTVRNFTPSEQASRVLQKGDLILEKSGGGEKTPVGRVVKFDLDAPAICSNFTNRLIPKPDFDSDFLIYLFFALYNNGVTVSHINQTTGIQNLQVGSFLDETVFIPTSIPEQRAIAAYLDRKTAQLDTLLAQKEALLQKLQQKRQALINEAVTQGLNPAAPRKPSGVAWLGEVPAHWEVKRLKQLTTKIGSGVTPLGGAEVYQDKGVPLFRSQNIYSDGLRLDDVAFVTEEVHESMKNSQVETGDVLLNITGASIGRCYFYQGENKRANVNQHVCIIRPNEQITTEYLQLVLASNLGQHQIDMSQNGASREGLTFSQLKEFRIPCPAFAEQQVLVQTINLRLQKISEASTAIRTRVEANADLAGAFIPQNSEQNIRTKFDEVLDDVLEEFVNTKLDLFNKLTEDKTNAQLKRLWFQQLLVARLGRGGARPPAPQ